MNYEDAFHCLDELRTDRLVLRQIKIEDAIDIHAFKGNEKFAILVGEEPYKEVEQTAIWISENLNAYEKKEAMTWAIVATDNGKVIGECCLWNFSSGGRCAEIGYELNPDYWHMGYMTEALRELIEHGFSVLDLHRIEADTLAINTSSRALLERMGFTCEGVLRQRHYFRERFEDQVLYGLLKNEWIAR